MFFMSLLQDGPCSLQSNAPDHIASEQGSSTDHPAPGHPFSAEPSCFSQVDVDVPGCPINDDELHELEGWLQVQVDVNIQCMDYLNSVWIDAMDFCSRLYGSDST
jgi:hypothetical protein